MLGKTRQFCLCVHCKRNKGVQGGGLCSGCWRRPEIRLLHPANAKHSARGLVAGNRAAPLDEEPTMAIPGSVEKQAVMAWRAEQGLAIFHPRDYPAGIPDEDARC